LTDTAVHVITQIGVFNVFPVSVSLILQKTLVVPATPEPVNVVDAEVVLVIVQLVPDWDHKYVYVPRPPVTPPLIEVVVAFPTAVNVLADIVVFKAINIFPKKADIYFILHK
jgi:hypothetical protein